MADSRVFDWVCDRLEEESGLNRLEARGTVRLALREAGLAPKSVTTDQVAVVFEKLLPGELAARSIARAEEVCSQLAREVREVQLDEGPAPESPEAVFKRLGG